MAPTKPGTTEDTREWGTPQNLGSGYAARLLESFRTFVDFKTKHTISDLAHTEIISIPYSDLSQRHSRLIYVFGNSFKSFDAYNPA